MFNIAIDGPAGAGKSSIAKEAARRLGFIYVDTGALYRTVALNAIRNNVSLNDPAAIAKTLPNAKISLAFADGTQRVMLNGEDVSEQIRTPDVSAGASKVSAVPAVRQYLFDLQKNLAAENDCLMDGRDIGTVVLPNAQLKVFLTASPEERARRRWNQLKEAGTEADYDEILKDVNQRDYQDTHREIAPLKQADDAILLDTTHMNFEEVVAELLRLTEERRHG
ncbi:MAG: (d)CMP kinase [Acutalibacteraceae bacterium]